MESIQDDDRAARIAAEQKASQFQDRYNKLLIQSTIDDTVRNSGGRPTEISALLTSKAQVGPQGKVVVITDAGAVSPHAAVTEMKSSEEYGYLWTGQQSNAAPDLSNLDSDTYRTTVRNKVLPGGRFSPGRGQR
ncbi:MAG TPA: hypothetical protein VHY91_14430 [Pirellulales bacterium]|jgi:hypothetical protein|nr:hypothetical protein [Pirellulales bacterium]